MDLIDSSITKKKIKKLYDAAAPITAYLSMMLMPDIPLQFYLSFCPHGGGKLRSGGP